jgi:hypothetical protein
MQMNPPAASVACRVCFVKNPRAVNVVGWKMDGQISFCAFVHGVALVHWIRSLVGKPACQGISFQSFGRFVSQQTVLFHLCGSVRAFSLTEIFLKIYELEHATVTCDSYSFSILRVMLLLLLRCATFFLSFSFEPGMS